MAYPIKSRFKSYLDFLIPWSRWMWVFAMDIGASIIGIVGSQHWAWLEDWSPNIWWIMLLLGVVGFAMERFHRARLNHEGRERAIRFLRQAYESGESLQEEVGRVRDNASHEDCDRLVKTRLIPWMDHVGSIVENTAWERIVLREKITTYNPPRTVEGIDGFIDSRLADLERVGQQHEVEGFEN
jgi:hypothetical protein